MSRWLELGFALWVSVSTSVAWAQPAPAPAPAPAPPAPADPAQPPGAPAPAQPPPAAPPPAAQPAPPPQPAPGYQQQQPGYPQPQPAPGYQQQPQQQPAPGYGQEAQWGAPAQPARPERSGFVGVGRVGFVIAGGGEYQFECDGSACLVDSLDNDYDDKSGFVLGMDFMGHVSPTVRLGGGFLWVPATEIEPDNADDYEAGTDLSLLFIIEGVFDVGPTVALAVRGMGGALFLFPGDDLEDDIDDAKNTCETIESAGGSCDVTEGPYVGWTLGGGAGVIVDVGPVALRADLLFQFYGINILSVDASDVTGDLETTNSLTGNRFLFMAGLEF